MVSRSHAEFALNNEKKGERWVVNSQGKSSRVVFVAARASTRTLLTADSLLYTTDNHSRLSYEDVARRAH